MDVFKFKVGERVRLVMSQETGEIVGRAEYSNGPAQYRVRYLAADGRQVEDWWTDDAIVSIEEGTALAA